MLRKIRDQITSAVCAWLAVHLLHTTTPGDDGLPMASGDTRRVPTTAMTVGMSSDMLWYAMTHQMMNMSIKTQHATCNRVFARWEGTIADETCTTKYQFLELWWEPYEATQC